MSQFLIAIWEFQPESKLSYLKFIPVEEAQPLFGEAAKYHNINLSEAWAVLDKNVDTTDELFYEASLELSQADKLSKTDLGILIGELLHSQTKMLAWYASNYKDVDLLSNAIELIELINAELPISSGEAYFYYA